MFDPTLHDRLASEYFSAQDGLEHEMDINISGTEYVALITYDRNCGDIYVTEARINLDGTVWARIEPDHFGLIEKQMIEQSAGANLDSELAAMNSDEGV